MNDLAPNRIRNCKCILKHQLENFTAFSNIVNADNFQEQCDAAVLDPNRPIAQSLLHDIFPVVHFSGENVPFGPAERA